MTLLKTTGKTKIGWLAVSTVLAAGLSFSLAQTSAAPAAQTQPIVAAKAQLLTPSDQALLLSLVKPNISVNSKQRLAQLNANWTPAYVAPSLEIYNFIADGPIRRAVLYNLRTTTGQDFGADINAWYRWLWNQPELKTEGYDNFKAKFYKAIDPRFEKYFKGRLDTAHIRLDEIRWGGVRQDGIPPLRQPKMISAAAANYLDDDNVIFGIEVNGDVRAYPKRILAWHEMFVDNVGGVDVAGVYCTLCGTVILYDTTTNGTPHNIGTSGFLYRSNKLMYDKATQSLWNTIKGEPVLGPLTGKGIALDYRSVVTTTWGEWKRRHPNTQVLSIDTGYNRNYGEGVAYHAYFATDDLMFNTPYNDQRLQNKDEVLALRFKSSPREQLAISADFLKNTPVYMDKLGAQTVLVLTDKSGANRVYDPKEVRFKSFDGDVTAIDSDGEAWTLSESKLVSEDGRALGRLPYNRAFWFGWHATYPNSRLVK